MADNKNYTVQYGFDTSTDAWWDELRDGFANRGWYIVTDDGRYIVKGGKPTGSAPARKPKGTDTGFAIIKGLLENA